MIVIKLGGSVITDKKKSGKFRAVVVKRLALELANFVKKSKEPIVLVHGGGGRCHALARKYGMSGSRTSVNTNKEFLAVQSEVASLQSQIARLLSKAGLSSKKVRTEDFFTYTVDRFAIKKILNLKKTLALGQIPILSANVLRVGKNKYRILSGDNICIQLAKALKVEKIIFTTDVDGFYLSKKKLLKKASVKQVRNILGKITHYVSTDVTGDLPGKLKTILGKPLKSAVHIVNGLKTDKLTLVLKGGTPGTVIK